MKENWEINFQEKNNIQGYLQIAKSLKYAQRILNNPYLLETNKEELSHIISSVRLYALCQAENVKSENNKEKTKKH